jgi:hypothetical protein
VPHVPPPGDAAAAVLQREGVLRRVHTHSHLTALSLRFVSHMLLRYVVCGGCVDALSPAAAPCSASDDMTAVVSGVSAAAFKASPLSLL